MGSRGNIFYSLFSLFVRLTEGSGALFPPARTSCYSLRLAGRRYCFYRRPIFFAEKLKIFFYLAVPYVAKIMSLP
jgi:hypothetical protein